MSDQPDPRTLLAAAVDARRRADELLLARFRNPRATLSTWEKAPGALVTDADIASDTVIADSLRASGIGGRIISEETPTDLGGNSDVEWLVDPLCGTVPYSTGMTHWGVNIAARLHGKLVAATFSTPASGEAVDVVAGGDATTEAGEPLAAAATSADETAEALAVPAMSAPDAGEASAFTTPLADATVALEVDRKDVWQRIIGSGELGWVARVGQVNAFASAAYPLMQVCRRRLAGVVFYCIEPMHVAPGALAATAAGAKATDGTGHEIDWGDDAEIGVLVVAWGAVHGGLVG